MKNINMLDAFNDNNSVIEAFEIVEYAVTKKKIERVLSKRGKIILKAKSGTQKNVKSKKDKTKPTHQKKSNFL